MPCPACMIALMGTDTPTSTSLTEKWAGLTTGQKAAVVGTAAVVAWILFPTKLLKPNRRRRGRNRRR